MGIPYEGPTHSRKAMEKLTLGFPAKQHFAVVRPSTSQFRIMSTF